MVKTCKQCGAAAEKPAGASAACDRSNNSSTDVDLPNAIVVSIGDVKVAGRVHRNIARRVQHGGCRLSAISRKAGPAVSSSDGNRTHLSERSAAESDQNHQ